MLVAAVAAGVGGALAGCHPTLTTVVDPLLTGGLAALVTWAAATAPWWAPALAAGLLAIADPAPWKLAVAALACLAMFVVGARRDSAGVVRALSGGVAVQLALRLDIADPFGRSALVAAVLLGLILITGVARRPGHVRRRLGWAAVAAGGFCALALALTTIGALGARSKIQKGVDAASAGLSALRTGDSKKAAEQLAIAAHELAGARSAVQAPWMWPARTVPVLSQHVRAASALVKAAQGAAATVSTAVGTIDLDALRVRAGAIDIQAVAGLVPPLEISVSAVQRLDAAVAAARSGWLVAPLGHRLGKLADETAKASAQATNALEVARVAPRLLGQDGPRVWFVLFTTPAEARGLGGFPGNFAELTVANGQMSVTRFGRSTDLINGGDDPAHRTISGPSDFLTRYGPFGAGGNGEPMDRLFWNNVTLSPDLPSVAQVVAEIYPQSGGTAIDGVIVADPVALQGVLSLIGPLKVPTIDLTLTPSNVTQFLLVDQYKAFPGANNERKDALADVAQEATEALIHGNLPGPPTIARALGTPIRTGHLMIWSLHPEDQPALDALGVSGRMPRAVSDGFAYTINNSGPNKLDAYLTRSMSYQAVVDARTGLVAATATLRLRNTLPTPITLPSDVISNEKGLPPGTNRVYLSVYTPLQLTSADVDGAHRALASDRELGWNVLTTYLNIAPGQEVVLTLQLGGQVSVANGYRLTLRPQPLASPNATQVNIKILHPKSGIAYSGSLDVVTTLEP